ncbi:hypothetical protein Sango_2051600 [Sesamum angolense]|uniref:Uncharacterized protein n=1 Tax=Sesamum angolense TaxID=2727404 RepID=A0AAE1WG45_9LAMI|nr:hypothetical protein Sango_2051600 [Sesamum angolense]
MPRKSKGVVLESTPPFGVGGYDDAKARMKHQALMQEYQELQREVDFMRSKIQAGKQRKRVLTAEVWFLRRRYECLVKTKTMNSIQKEKLTQPPNLTQSKSRKEDGHCRLTPVPKSKSKKKHCIGRADIRKTLARNITPVLDLNQKERMHGANETALKNTIAPFDLNWDNALCRKEASFPSRAPVFDLTKSRAVPCGEEENFVAGSGCIESLKHVVLSRGPSRGPKNFPGLV